MINKTLLQHGETIAVALSGGKDSICLLSLLLEAKKEFNLNVKAVHVNHNIRLGESDRDADFVKNYCEKLGVPIEIFSVNAIEFSSENHYSLEQGARILRYQIFADLIKRGYADKIATAHHANDNFETLLFNVFRGAGLKGAKGISSTANYVIRPLLQATRADIENFITTNNLPFVQDSTNFDNDITRNYIRNVITPKILEKFPDAITSANRFCTIAEEEDAFLDDLANKALEQNGDKIYLSLSQPSVIVKRATILALNKLGVDKDYEFIHAVSVDNLKNLQSGAKITLPKNVIAKREYDYVIFSAKEEEKCTLELPFKQGTFEFFDKVVEISSTILEKPYLLFDGDKIPQGAVIRTRRDGDVFTKFGGGTKKLKDYLIDKKIPLSSRDNLLLVAKNNVVYMIIGMEISDLVRIDDKTINKLKVKLQTK